MSPSTSTAKVWSATNFSTSRRAKVQQSETNRSELRRRRGTQLASLGSVVISALPSLGSTICNHFFGTHVRKSKLSLWPRRSPLPLLFTYQPSWRSSPLSFPPVQPNVLHFLRQWSVLKYVISSSRISSLINQSEKMHLHDGLF